MLCRKSTFADFLGILGRTLAEGLELHPTDARPGRIISKIAVFLLQSARHATILVRGNPGLKVEHANAAAPRWVVINY